MSEKRLVVITGEQGIGKSAVARGVTNYLAVRRAFPGGLYFIRLRVRGGGGGGRARGRTR